MKSAKQREMQQNEQLRPQSHTHHESRTKTDSSGTKQQQQQQQQQQHHSSDDRTQEEPCSSSSALSTRSDHVSLEEKSDQLPGDLKRSFQRSVAEMSLQESVAMVDLWHQTRIELDTEVELKNKEDAAAGKLCSSQSSPKLNTDYDSDYEEEKNVIMKRMTKAQSWMECERSRQVELLRQRKEMKKAGQDKSHQMANKLVGHVTASEEQKMKEKERQRQLINNRLEERRKQKSKTDKN